MIKSFLILALSISVTAAADLPIASQTKTSHESTDQQNTNAELQIKKQMSLYAEPFSQKQEKFKDYAHSGLPSAINNPPQRAEALSLDGGAQRP